MISNCYEIQNVSHLKQTLKKESKKWTDFDEQLKTNQCYIFYLHSGEVILLPNNLLDNSKGILFHDIACYREYLSNDYFPIENPQMKIYEKYQPELLNLKNEMGNILQHLASILNFNIDTSNNNLAGLILRIKEAKNKISLKDKFYTVLAVGEYLRRANNGNWILIKRYGEYNPYFVPGILYSNNNQILLILDYFPTYFDNESLTLDAFVNSQHIKQPGFALESLKFSRFPNSYKIL